MFPRCKVFLGAGKAGRTLLFISAMCATLPVRRLTQTLYFLGRLFRLIPNCSHEHFTPQHILLPGTFYSLTQFAPWNTPLPGTFCSLELYALCIFFPPQYTLFSKQSTPVTIVFKGEKCSKKQSVPGSKVICDIKSTQ